MGLHRKSFASRIGPLHYESLSNSRKEVTQCLIVSSYGLNR